MTTIMTTKNRHAGLEYISLHCSVNHWPLMKSVWPLYCSSNSALLSLLPANARCRAQLRKNGVQVMAVFEEVVAVALVERVPRARRPTLVFRSHRGPQQLALDARPEVRAKQKTWLHVVVRFLFTWPQFSATHMPRTIFTLFLVECGAIQEERAKRASC